MKIHYVEDHDDNIYMLKNRLSRAGFTVIIATDGTQGIAMASSEQPDLILMDLTLPDIRGARHYDQVRFRFHTTKTLSGRWVVNFAVLHNGPRDVVGCGRPPPGGLRETARHRQPETLENAAPQAD